MGTEVKIYVGYRVVFMDNHKDIFKTGDTVSINKTAAKNIHAGKSIELGFYNGYDTSYTTVPANIVRLERVNRTVTVSETFTYHPVTF